VTPTTVPDALRDALARDGARPFLTWLGADGARVELSVRTFENNVAKAANLLQDDASVSSGSRAVLRLAPHWQTAVWLAACAVTSTTAWLDGDESDPRVALAVVGPDVTAAGPAPLTLATSLHPLGMPFTTPLPVGVLDAAMEVRAHGDRFIAYDPPRGDTPWFVDGDRESTQQQSLENGVVAARGLDLRDRGRLLVRSTQARASYGFVLAALAIPLAIDAGVVLVTDATADIDELAEREHCDAVHEV
jgi:uncharacterized protein (TIGR03089 family)